MIFRFSGAVTLFYGIFLHTYFMNRICKSGSLVFQFGKIETWISLVTCFFFPLWPWLEDFQPRKGISFVLILVSGKFFCPIIFPSIVCVHPQGSEGRWLPRIRKQLCVSLSRIYFLPSFFPSNWTRFSSLHCFLPCINLDWRQLRGCLAFCSECLFHLKIQLPLKSFLISRRLFWWIWWSHYSESYPEFSSHLSLSQYHTIFLMAISNSFLNRCRDLFPFYIIDY